MADRADLWADRAFLRDVQYRTDANLAARQSIYAYQHPRIDLPARVLDLAPDAVETVADVGCGNGVYLAELARRGLGGRLVGADLSAGMLRAARGDPQRLVAGVLARLSDDSGGNVRITTHAGCLLCA